MLSLVAVAISALPAFAAVLLFSMTGCAALRPDRPDGFVSLAEAVPDAILEPRYYSTYNFIGDRIDGYEEPCAILSKEAAAALKEASDEAVRRGYRFKMCELLSHSTLPIAMVVERSGYESDGYAKRFFLRRTGMTMREYRRQTCKYTAPRVREACRLA